MNKTIKRHTDGTQFLLGGAMISGFISAIIVWGCTVEKYTWLILLPLSFGFISILFNGVYRLMGKSITVSLLVALMFLKNVIIPIFMALGDGYFAAHVDTASKMFPAVLLEIYEELVVFMILNWRLKRLGKSISSAYMEVLEVRKDKVKAFSLITFIVLLIAVGCFALYPQLVSYISVGVLGDTDKTIQQVQLQTLMKETVPILFYYTYTFAVNVLRWIVPAMVMFRLYLSRKREMIKILLSFLVIGLSVIMMTDTVAVSVYIALAFSLLMCKMYPMQRRRILTFSVLAVGIAGTVLLFIKTFGSGEFKNTDIGEIAYMLQAYFSGPENVAVALKINTSLSFSEIVGDIVKFIPYLMYFFKALPSSNIVFNQTYWGSTDITTQIIPMISQGARHFTVILAPIYTVIITNIALKWEIKATNKNELLDYTVCAIGCVCFSMAVAMYNASLCIQLYLNYVFPIQFMVWFIKKISVKGKL